MVYQHDPMHVDVLVKDLELAHGNSVETPVVHDVTNDETKPLDQMHSDQHRSQVAKMFVPQSIPCVQPLESERAAPSNVKPHASEPCHVENANQIFETRNTMETDLQVWKCVKM